MRHQGLADISEEKGSTFTTVALRDGPSSQERTSSGRHGPCNSWRTQLADDPLLTITLSKTDGGFRADLHAPAEKNGVADLRLWQVSPHAVEAIEACLAELEARAAEGHDIALRFA